MIKDTLKQNLRRNVLSKARIIKLSVMPELSSFLEIQTILIAILVLVLIAEHSFQRRVHLNFTIASILIFHAMQNNIDAKLKIGIL